MSAIATWCSSDLRFSNEEIRFANVESSNVQALDKTLVCTQSMPEIDKDTVTASKPSC